MGRGRPAQGRPVKHRVVDLALYRRRRLEDQDALARMDAMAHQLEDARRARLIHHHSLGRLVLAVVLAIALGTALGTALGLAAAAIL